MTSELMQMAERCLGGQLCWRGSAQGLLGFLNRDFVIESEGMRENGALVFNELLQFSDGVTERRSWRLSEGPDGLLIDAEGVELLRPGRIEGDELVIDYLTKFGGLAFEYEDRFRPLPDGEVDNLGRAKRFGVVVMTIRCRARPGRRAAPVGHQAASAAAG